jgi:hypothetical protein
MVVALGGTSYAVTALPRNSVGTEQIKDRSILATDLKPSELAKLKGPAGPPGPTRATGAPGAAGPTGPTGATGPAHVIDASGQVVGGLRDQQVEHIWTTYYVEVGSKVWRFKQDGSLVPGWDSTAWTNSSRSGTPVLIGTTDGMPGRARATPSPYLVIQAVTPLGTKA